MQRIAFVLPFLVAACAGGAEDSPMTPAYDGPALRANRAADGGVEFVMVVPTASHELRVQSVSVRDRVAEVRLEHVTPGDAMVAQVVSEVHAVVDGARLGDAAELCVWVARRPRDGRGAGAPAAMALRAPRP